MLMMVIIVTIIIMMVIILIIRRTDKSERVWRSALPDITAAITTLRLLRSSHMVILFMMVRMYLIVSTVMKTLPVNIT